MTQGKRLTDFESVGGSEFEFGEFDLRRALQGLDRTDNEVPEDPMPMFISGDEYADRYDDEESASPLYVSPLYQPKPLVEVIFSSRIFQVVGLAGIAAAIVFAVVSVGNPFMVSSRSQAALTATAADPPTASEPLAREPNRSPIDASSQPPPSAIAATTGIATWSPGNPGAPTRDDVAVGSRQSQPVIRQPEERPAAPALRVSRMDPDQLALFRQYKNWEAGSADGQAASADRSSVDTATPTKFEEFLKRKFDDFQRQNPSGSKEMPPEAYREALFKQFQAWELEHGGRAQAAAQPRPQRRRAAAARPVDAPIPLAPIR